MKKSNSISKYALSVALPYIIAGGIWIILSDRVLALFISDVDSMTAMQTYKGWFYVLLSGWLVYSLAKRYLGRIARASEDVAKHELALTESRRATETLYSNLPGMVYRCANDDNWTMYALSSGCLNLTGYQPEELIDNAVVSYADLIIEEDRPMVYSKVQEAVNDKSSFHLEYRITDKQGQEKWVWEQGCGVFDNQGQLVALEGYIFDITQKKNLENEVRETERLKHIGQAASTIIHDLKNSMQIIVGYVELVLGKITDARAAKYLGKIDDQVKSMVSMSRGLLDYARGEMSVTLELENIEEILRSLVDTYKPAFEKVGVDLKLICRQEQDASPLISLDQEKFSRALINLIGNAKDVLSNGGEIQIHSWVDRGAVRIDVKDNGPGVPESVQHNLFQPFVTHGKARGTGLGLAITRKIVEAHQGAISFSSEPSKGTTFTIIIPRDNAVGNPFHSESVESA